MPDTGSEWCLLLCLLFHHNLERGSWPSEATILEKTGLSRSTYHRALKGLIERRLVRQFINTMTYVSGGIEAIDGMILQQERGYYAKNKPLCDQAVR